MPSNPFFQTSARLLEIFKAKRLRARLGVLKNALISGTFRVSVPASKCPLQARTSRASSVYSQGVRTCIIASTTVPEVATLLLVYQRTPKLTKSQCRFSLRKIARAVPDITSKATLPPPALKFFFRAHGHTTNTPTVLWTKPTLTLLR